MDLLHEEVTGESNGRGSKVEQGAIRGRPSGAASSSFIESFSQQQPRRTKCRTGGASFTLVVTHHHWERGSMRAQLVIMTFNVERSKFPWCCTTFSPLIIITGGTAGRLLFVHRHPMEGKTMSTVKSYALSPTPIHPTNRDSHNFKT